MKNDGKLIVFIDSATRLFYIAVKDLSDNSISVKRFTHKELKGEAILAVLRTMFEEKNYSPEDIRFMATTSGPGSLTGLRICMSTIKTVSQVLDIPIVTLPTLYALEGSCSEKKDEKFEKIYTILMARKNHYYIREHSQPKNSFTLVNGEALEETLNEDSLYIVEENSTPTVFCDKNNINFVNIALNPEVIMDLCLLDLDSGISQDYSECLPEYGGKSVAEVNFEKRNKENML